MEIIYKIGFTVPLTHSERVKEACFEAGAGKIGSYDKCSWEYQVKGQFRPLDGSNPFIGQKNQVELVDEIKVEMLCPHSNIENVIHALKLAHPYEVPVYEVIRLDYI